MVSYVMGDIQKIKKKITNTELVSKKKEEIINITLV